MNAPLRPVPLHSVALSDTFWAPRQEITRRVTLPVELRHCRATGRIDAFRLEWRPGQPNPPHMFWDSDVAKWVEAAAYSLATHPDPELERALDEVVELIVSAQQPDGYLNVHFTVVEPDKRWTNLRDWHELYCAGHLMEAAVAHKQATGKDTLLEALCRYADHIASRFGPEEGQRRGYPGHEEIELALVKLYRQTGELRYLNLARFFVDERGRQPHYYELEAQARGDDPATWQGRDYRYNQAHLPVREQETAEGHAVRAMYLYSGMTDVAAETGDRSLLEAVQRLWANVTQRRMYLTGGVGSAREGERFTWDYHLPNYSAYTETCAAIGLVFWAHRLLQVEPKGEYADAMERALYNGVLSGISLSGDRFFYVNPLALDYQAYRHEVELFGRSVVAPERQEWFPCACCPPNIARMLTSLGQYLYSLGEDALYVHLYVGGRAAVSLAGNQVALTQETGYPWREQVRLTVEPERETEFTLALRLPGWCREPELTVNGEAIPVHEVTQDGYAYLRRKWKAGDVVELMLPMPVERVYAHPEVRDDAGRVALQRGPLVYCLEQVDNGPNLEDIRLPRSSELRAHWEPDLLGGVMIVRGEGTRRGRSGWDGRLYRSAPPAEVPVEVVAVPYYAWANREPGDMLVWMRE
ncbi:MAG: glycoside hydrolase family 127 protein [Anaerolineae bacterium]|nr:glycoside hydrolase family 127 protein [Anaerolineae bacterium]